MLARASAGLAECAAGIRLHGTGQVIRMSPDGRPTAGPQASDVAAVARLTIPRRTWRP
ncbi:hypothetical protein [Spongiactinospora sp. TRM90649]|uniref:hypothetical protein n=1 Tax=Spongiactinospora sp. TRM90649 TaxID=3031114 RepID=UPI0023F9359C|nr:hypothetical protein [Spongiactinospora sp. TRM90649]MDF5758885.1 hypothetical protein [Spongiactinospora sp. TRM90649]